MQLLSIFPVQMTNFLYPGINIPVSKTSSSKSLRANASGDNLWSSIGYIINLSLNVELSQLHCHCKREDCQLAEKLRL